MKLQNDQYSIYQIYTLLASYKNLKIIIEIPNCQVLLNKLIGTMIYHNKSWPFLRIGAFTVLETVTSIVKAIQLESDYIEKNHSKTD